MKQRVFISGPMTGYPNENREAFAKAEKMLMNMGYSVFNPARIPFDENWTHEEIMDVDITALIKCNWIYMLDNWQASKGSVMEHRIAEAYSIPVLNQELFCMERGMPDDPR